MCRRRAAPRTYEDALLSFYETLDPQEDSFYVKAADPDVAAFRDKAMARAQDLLNHAQTQWQQYRANGSIGGTQRLEAGISDTFRIAGATARRCAGRRAARHAHLHASEGRWRREVAKTDSTTSMRKRNLQRRSLQELRMVLEPGLLRASWH